MKIYNLDADSDYGGSKLTVGEALERLKKNPDDPDPEVQEFKKSMDEFYETIAHGASLSVSMRGFSDIVDTVGQIRDKYLGLGNLSKAIIKSFAELEAPLLSPVLPVQDTVFFTTGFTDYVNVELEPASMSSRMEEILREQKKLSQQVERLIKEKPQWQGKLYFDKETGAVVVRRETLKAFNLNTGNGEDGMMQLFSVLVEILDDEGEIKDSFRLVKVTIAELLKRLKIAGVTNATRSWIRSTKSNLKRTKLEPAKMEKDIVLGSHQKEFDGFYFKVRLG